MHLLFSQGLSLGHLAVDTIFVRGMIVREI